MILKIEEFFMFEATKIEDFLKGNIKIPQFDYIVANKAKDFQKQLTKPEGSLGKLEDIAIWMSGWQKHFKPTINNPHCIICLLYTSPSPRDNR